MQQKLACYFLKTNTVRCSYVVPFGYCQDWWGKLNEQTKICCKSYKQLYKQETTAITTATKGSVRRHSAEWNGCKAIKVACTNMGRKFHYQSNLLFLTAHLHSTVVWASIPGFTANWSMKRSGEVNNACNPPACGGVCKHFSLHAGCHSWHAPSVHIYV